MLLTLRVVTFCGAVRVSLSRAPARQRGSRAKHQKAAGRAAAGGARFRRACEAVQCSRRAVQRVPGGSAAMLSVVCWPVSGKPVQRRAMQACRRARRAAYSVQQQRQQQSRADRQGE